MTIRQLHMAIGALEQDIKDVAEGSGVPAPTLSRILNRHRTPNYKTMMRLRRYFESHGLEFRTQEGKVWVAAPSDDDVEDDE